MRQGYRGIATTHSAATVRKSHERELVRCGIARMGWVGGRAWRDIKVTVCGTSQPLRGAVDNRKCLIHLGERGSRDARRGGSSGDSTRKIP